MKKVYKNAIFHHLLNNELGIDNFAINESETLSSATLGKRTTFEVAYKPFPTLAFYFVDCGHSFDHFDVCEVSFTPDLRIQNLTNPDAGGVSFTDALYSFNEWLENDVKNYINEAKEVDLWAAYQNQVDTNNNIATIDYQDISEFTVGEKEGIKLALSELKLLITERFVTDDKQNEIVDRQIKYLTERVEVLNQTDWKGILINTFISICISLSLDAQKGQELMQLLIQVFQFAPGLLK